MKNSIAELIALVETKHNVQSITTSKFNKTFEIYPWIKAKVFHKMVLGKESLASKSTKSLLGQFKSLFYGRGIYLFANMKFGHLRQVLNELKLKESIRINFLIEFQAFQKINF
jgi:hypothetical protein